MDNFTLVEQWKSGEGGPGSPAGEIVLPEYGGKEAPAVPTLGCTFLICTLPTGCNPSLWFGC
ncbi:MULTISPECIES: hypothetical protein [unclassified Nonomuraea]|uniref:hypothetical protein n=1 Tax=unclassified Nonomuraea TaxID=2593643 RepID=UPI0035BF4DB1